MGRPRGFYLNRKQSKMSLMMGQGCAGRVGLEATEQGLKEAREGSERQAGLPSSCSTRLCLGLDAYSAPVRPSSVG